MIQILYKACCNSCPHIDVDYETFGTGITTPTTMIGCKHMCVCGQYQTEEDETQEDTAQDVIVKGFQNADG